MSYFTETWPTASKPHVCGTCRRSIRAGETYRRGVGFDGGSAWTYKECEHCAAAAWAYLRQSGDDEYSPESVIEWLADEYPTTYGAMRAGWAYPDGELTPAPFEPRCYSCGRWVSRGQTWCIECDAVRIARISRQLEGLRL